jgi:hypothetical protein
MCACALFKTHHCMHGAEVFRIRAIHESNTIVGIRQSSSAEDQGGLNCAGPGLAGVKIRKLKYKCIIYVQNLNIYIYIYIYIMYIVYTMYINIYTVYTMTHARKGRYRSSINACSMVCSCT